MIENVLGHTPMVKIKYRFRGQENVIFAKLESFNLTGSIKDRVAYYMIKEGKKNGSLKENQPIVEATSGNTGISLAALGALFHHKVHIFMPIWASEERKKIMKSYGATLTLVTKEEGGFQACLEKASKFAQENHAFYPDQFSSKANFLAHYETTGPEIFSQVDQEIGGFVSGVGTGGTLMGIGKYLKEKNSDFKVAAIEPANMPLLSKKEILGPHQIEGIGDDFIPALVDEDMIDEIYLIRDEEALEMSKRLAKELGLGVGISSGANFLGCVLLGDKIHKPVVTVFADDHKKYLTTALVQEKTEKDLVVNQIEFLHIEFIK